MSTAREAWHRWQAGAGAWKGWSVCPTLLAPDIEGITPQPVERPLSIELATRIASSIDKGGVLVVLELEPILGVHVAALLNEWRIANAVLLLPRWPYRQAVLPVDGLTSALVSQARRLCDQLRLPNVAFVLDSERSKPVRRRLSDERADNRYRVLPGDLPNLAALRAHGIREVRKVARS